MPAAKVNKLTYDRPVSRRDFLKASSLVIGAMAFPGDPTRAFEEGSAAPQGAVDPRLYFQWQNEFLCKTIYPMREVKLRDFLIYYQEVDVWSQYKTRDLNALTVEVDTYKKEWEANTASALEEYEQLRDYFRTRDVRSAYSNFQPIDEAELNEIHNLHGQFTQSWPKDIRGERYFVETMIANWALHRQAIKDWIKGRKRRLDVMAHDHPRRDAETRELELKESSTLPMAEQEMSQLRAFLATYDRIEQPKLAWYRLSRNDPNFKTPEADFLTKYPADGQVTLRDLAYWRVEKYTKSIAEKNQYELLDEIYQRFQREPGRFPSWLQYMVVHFSGMRYASAHGSWADPKDLLIRMRVLDVERELKALNDAEIERRCREKVLAYESTGGTDKPGLALATEKEWQEKVELDMQRVKANGPKTRRAGLLALQTDEISYEIRSLSTEDALQGLREMRSAFPDWAWKEIVRFTPLRVTEVTGPDWEKLTPQEEEERYSYQNNDIRAVLDAWENDDPTAWRDEHGRTLELIVTRAVCNEAAEHCQHIRGHLPPGGLAARPKWYLANEGENPQPGSYFVKPVSDADYTQGAGILWLRFVSSSSSNPTEWRVARWIETKQKVGLLPEEFKTRTGKDGEWVYRLGDVITRSRTIVTSEKRKIVENQWLRWIHEATVAEAAETADGMTVITFETALPGGLDGSSAVGTFKVPLDWLLSDGTEDQYNRSFAGYVPERQIPFEHLREMLDWNKIFRRKVL